MTVIIAIVILSLAGSFLCSISEAALYSIPYGRIETLRRLKAAGGARRALLRQNVEEPIAAILAMNTIFNVMGGVWAGALVQSHYGETWMIPFSLGFTAAVLILSEVTPKSLGVRFADTLAPRLAWPLQILVWSLWPYVKFARALMKIFGRSARISYPTEEDLISTAMLSERGGKILPQEARLIKNVLRLNEVRVRDIMTPHSKIRRVSDRLPLSMTKVDAGHWRYKRIPVCKDGAPDNIVGVVNRRTVFSAMLRGKPETTMAELMKPIQCVREDLPAHELLNLFIGRKTQIACVQNAQGKLVGLVSLEDVLEDMLGEEIE